MNDRLNRMKKADKYLELALREKFEEISRNTSLDEIVEYLSIHEEMSGEINEGLDNSDVKAKENPLFLNYRHGEKGRHALPDRPDASVPGERNSIFLSYVDEDKAQVRDLYERLKERGYEPWLDEVDLLPGQIWKDQIPKAIANAGVFLACLSRRSVGKIGYVQNEFRRALSAFSDQPSGSIYLIPIRLDDCEIPDIRIAEPEFTLNQSPCVDLFDEYGFDSLFQVVQSALRKEKTPSTSYTHHTKQKAKTDIVLAEIGTVLKPIRSSVDLSKMTGESSTRSSLHGEGRVTFAKPDAFLSYTRFDDRRGRVSEFRTWLSDAVGEVSGDPFDIFQDIEGIGLGEKWQDVLDEMLDQARFFIPILTPKFFNSEPCRNELIRFLDLESKTGRQDLILPIYWITCPVLEERRLKTKDKLAQAIDERQRWDWRELRHGKFQSKQLQLALSDLASQIERARRDVLRVVGGVGWS